MGKIIKFVNLLILFNSIFLVATDVSGKPFQYPFELSCLSYIQNISSPLIFVPYFFLLQHIKGARKILIVEFVVVHIPNPMVPVCIDPFCRCRRPLLENNFVTRD